MRQKMNGRMLPFLSLLMATLAIATTSCGPAQGEDENLHDIQSDLDVPGVTVDEPGPGVRFWKTLPEYEGWHVRHAVYLPTNWEPDGSYPVIFEYPGNGGFKNERGDRSDGRVEDCLLGYGLTGGEDAIWVSLPFVDPKTRSHTIRWWGSPDETVKYCKLAVAQICDEYGGDPERLVLSGFSRGAIACNFIGLWDDEIASLWCAFFPHSHYDGVHLWGYEGSDRDSARKRLARLNGRPQWISHESSVEDVREYLAETGVDGAFHLVVLPYPNHSPRWVLKDLPIRREARQWLGERIDR